MHNPTPEGHLGDHDATEALNLPPAPLPAVGTSTNRVPASQRSWLRRHRTPAIIAGVTAVVLIGGAIAYSPIEYAIVHAAATTTRDGFTVDAARNHAAQNALTAALTDATAAAISLTGVVADSDGYVSSETRTALIEAADTLTTIIDGRTAVPAIRTTTPVSTQDLRTHTTGQLRNAINTLHSGAGNLQTHTEQITASRERLTTAQADATLSLVPVIDSVPGIAEAITAATPSAGINEQTEFTNALTALVDARTEWGTRAGPDTPLNKVSAGVATTALHLVDPMSTYLTAAKTLQNSHTTAETQKAIDAAAAADTESYIDPSTGETKPNPTYRGSNTNGSSGSEGRGGSGSGGSGSGGNTGSSGGGGSGSGGGGSSDSRSAPQVIVGSHPCSGAGGSATASYNNRGIAIPGSGVAGYNGPYDNGNQWEITWTCAIDTGW